MRSKVLLIAMALVLVAGAATFQFTQRTSASPSSAQECVFGYFEATVRQGPSMGTQLEGELHLGIDDSGGLIGSFLANDGTSMDVVGQANGRAINLAIAAGTDENGEAAWIFGVGTLINNISECAGVVGGPFVGPQAGDTGDWLGCGGLRGGASSNKGHNGSACIK